MGYREATIEALYRVEGKAEIVGGEIVLMPAAGGFHGYVVGEILASLREHARRTKQGIAFGDGVGFVVNLPNRWSFSPDAAFWVGRLTARFRWCTCLRRRGEKPGGFRAGSPERQADKRADYFAAGTLVVWDVDMLRDHVVRVYPCERSNFSNDLCGSGVR